MLSRVTVLATHLFVTITDYQPNWYNSDP